MKNSSLHYCGQMLALSVLDTMISVDSVGAGGSWLHFLSGRGYLQHLVDSVAEVELPVEEDVVGQWGGVLRPS